MEINETANRAYQSAMARGHYQEGREDHGVTGYLALIHGEVSRSLDAQRQGETDLCPPHGRASGPLAHLADGAVRTMTLATHYGLDLEKAVRSQLVAGSGGKAAELTSEDMSRAAWNIYAAEYGDPSAAMPAETAWDGHQELARAGRTMTEVTLQSENNGVRLEEAPQSTKDDAAQELAKIFVWFLGAAQQSDNSFIDLIEATVRHHEGRGTDPADSNTSQNG